ncbi:MAG: hypothetical protein JSR86_20800 [Proteobacteria bacterium]|nr:hypothetical protein [Pseudomonadota bacterium]
MVKLTVRSAGALFAGAILIATLGSCQQKADMAQNASAIDTAASVAASDLHPCTVTGTQLTVEDCQAAQYWLDQSKQGVAAFNAPTWMVQGQTRLVTLAIGVAPPPEPPATTPAASAGGSPADTASTQADTATHADTAATPAAKAAPHHHFAIETPHDVVAGATVDKHEKIVDYHPFVGRQMAADLEGDGFDIKPISPRVQPIADQAVTTWEWEVKARQVGKRTLTMKTAVVMIDSQGKPQPLIPTTETKPVSVWIGFEGVLDILKALPDWLKALAGVGTAAGALFAAWKWLPFFRKPKDAPPKDPPD